MLRSFWFIFTIVGLAAGLCGTYAYDRYSPVQSFEAVDLETKAAVLTSFLSPTTREDHVVTDDGRIYLLVSEDLYAKLQRSTNGIKVERYTGATEVRANTVPYIVFSGWTKRADTVFVTQIAYFVGGNSGGCDEQYMYSKVSGWMLTKGDCFAAAS
ncbi:MAG: hypothetical protein K1X52_02535 [Pyrinomonadaceae bacterium]|nr:hypothetical protein [Pyrinomonadaceae bacterium]